MAVMALLKIKFDDPTLKIKLKTGTDYNRSHMAVSILSKTASECDKFGVLCIKVFLFIIIVIASNRTKVAAILTLW